ncbi:hypothetical protein [Gilliamella sp. Pas-s25]|uniref:hypothetical protein n=1 Tax=Gilliamella sp. Pas-s25 TaxID=2687310 RepID=UPI00135E8EF3|nr:hypothetical protein [Gilliamella sp. Pas-s25]MWP63054.1 hypothetical protein [Gilliamella sp. Pas-s25]
MHYHFRHQHWQTYGLNLSNRRIRRVSFLASFIFSKLFLKSLSKLSRKVLLALFLLSCLWHLPALAGQNGRGGNRSDAYTITTDERPSNYLVRYPNVVPRS